MHKMLFGSAVIAAGSCVFAAIAADNPAAPDISGFWQHSVPQEEWENPPSGPGPVRKMQGAKDLDPTYGGWMGDYHNPILQPWAAEAVRKEGEHEAAGGTAMTGQLTCRPSGVPGVFTVLAPVQIVQSPRVVAFLYQRDHQVRIVRMNAQHPAKPEPSYYGDSVGHYEGDTLVIDTIGMNDKTWTDRFGTPHTEALHVVERYTVTNGGKTLRDFFTVEDKGAFTTAWSAVLNYSRARQTVLEEEVCAENNRGLPVPVADIDPVSGRKLSGAAP
jgi:hypothetical protein